jgi:pyruvate dehydrogenase E1 component beta subunit/2-oxoisovalerate dehydrogenase E1 component beta subunit
MPSGGNPGSGPFHSQALESVYAHFPGLIVMTPATVEDAYELLLEAIALDDPVIFCEHKFLYNRVKADKLPEPNGQTTGKARIARPGRDLTVVSYSATVHDSLLAAQELSRFGIQIEVVDLRTVKPLDTETVLASVANTGRLLCVGESWPWGGVNAEVIARVANKGFHLLDSPPQRLNSRDVPIPYHPDLWRASRPSVALIVERVRQILQW